MDKVMDKVVDTVPQIIEVVEIEVKRRHKQQADRAGAAQCLTHCLLGCAIRAVFPDAKISVGFFTAAIDDRVYTVSREGVALVEDYCNEELDIATLPRTITLTYSRELSNYE